MKTPKPPSPPDPKEQAAAQTGTNVSTAQANAYLSNVDQYTPYGNLVYSDGQRRWIEDSNASGGGYWVTPRIATQTFSPEQQAIFDQSQAAELNLAKLANQQSGFFNEYLGKPLDLNNEAVESRLMELGSRRLQPQFDRRRAAMDAELFARGIRPGTEQYNRERERLSQQENDAFNQLLLQGRGQAVQEAIAERNQPINEISALLSQSQVQNPNFVNVNQPQMPTVDVAGLQQQNFDNRMGIYNTQLQQRNGMMSGLFGLGSSILGALPFSDIRLKEDIREVGQLYDGTKVYTFRYKGSKVTQIGVMAQEVAETMPQAVVQTGPYMQVDYARIAEAQHG